MFANLRGIMMYAAATTIVVVVFLFSGVQSSLAGGIKGVVVDSASSEPLSRVHISIAKAHKATVSNDEGEFSFEKLSAGEHIVVFRRVGYVESTIAVPVRDGDMSKVTVYLLRSEGRTAPVIVEKERREEWKSIVGEVTGSALREQLSRTIAETIAGEPGMDFRSMGSAPSRPVLRGLGGDRLLVLEDGERTGDLSATSADHAVVIEPIGAEKVEIIRGPGAFLYGSNVLGGAVNVERGIVPTILPDHLHGGLSLQGESVSRGIAGGAHILAPLGENIAYRVEGGGREAGDIQTPSGRLVNTALSTYFANAGASYFWNGGRIGGAVGIYDSQYGVPGGFVGAHPFGVDIELQRLFYEVRGDYHFSGTPFERVEVLHRYSRFVQREFEAGGLVGARFSVLSSVGIVNFFLRNSGMWEDGVIQARLQHRSAAFGGFVFAPNTDEWTPSLTYLQSVHFDDNFSVQASLRSDFHHVNPWEEGGSSIGFIRNRNFFGLSGAATLHWQPVEAFDVDFTITRAFRPPTLEELFSEGPHLAAYSFEVGNPDLNAETALGIDLTATLSGENYTFRTSVFRNSFQNYLFPRNTGDTNWATLLPIFQYTALPVVMYGGEISGALYLTSHLSVEGNVSAVYAQFNDNSGFPPFIPPVSARGTIRYHLANAEFGLRLQSALAQTRLDQFELPTDGFSVLGVFVEYKFVAVSTVYTITAVVENILNTEYRRHLSRVKEVMPEPGFNARLLGKMYF